MNRVPTEYELVIRRTGGWFTLNLAEVWQYRDLLLLLIHRDFIAKYKQTTAAMDFAGGQRRYTCRMRTMTWLS